MVYWDYYTVPLQPKGRTESEPVDPRSAHAAAQQAHTHQQVHILFIALFGQLALRTVSSVLVCPILKMMYSVALEKVF